MPDQFGPSVSAVLRRRRTVAAATVVFGAGILAGTLAAPSGSGLFYGLGLLTALIWIGAARMSGPVAWRRPSAAGPGEAISGSVEIAAAVLLGAVLFGGFLVAKLLGDQIPAVSGSVARVLARADTGNRAAVLTVALANGVGEEMFFRGALPAAMGTRAGAVWATVIYGCVTVATLNVALVVAALVMGTVFSVERRITGGVTAPIVTHLSWSALMILALPR